MDIRPTPLEGLFEIIPDKRADARGYFLELYRHTIFSRHFPGVALVQENLSFSKKGVLRGLHWQSPPAEQGKLVMVVSGSVLDVAVDLRSKSSSFGKAYTKRLDGMDHHMLWIPAGFAHGFYALEDTWLLYRCSGEYAPQYEAGLRWDDPDVGIPWGGVKHPILSTKDSQWPSLRELIHKSF